MFTAPTTALLEKNLSSLPRLVMERSLARDMDDLVADVLPVKRIAVVDDKDTSDALGNQVRKALHKHEVRHITLARAPQADDASVDEIRQKTAACDALVAVGSGTVNDICKYAATLDGKPYVVFPTAASMNGYLSANASISVKGYKKTVKGKMPEAVFCDLSVIAAAPLRLTKSGFGDSLARPTAQADWLLSNLLLDTAYNDTPFELLKPYEPELFDAARGIAKADPDTIKLLMQVLLLSGLGMTIAGGSYPASQAEHMIAHAYGMLQSDTPKNLHGEEIGITTLGMANRQEALLGIDPIFADTLFPEARITELFGDHVATEAKKAYAKKLELMNGREIGNWEKIAEKIAPVMMPPAKILALLQAAECKTNWLQLGWTQDNYLAVSGVARFLRERFTFLDLC